MLTEANKLILKKRLMSLVWRLGGMSGAVVLEFITSNIGLIDLPGWMVIFIGLVISEITKWLNTKK